MVSNRIRAILLGFLTVVAAGSFVASAAAEPGPFWHHRAIGGTGDGLKIDQPKDEQFQGKGGEQILTGTVGTTPIKIVAPLAQVKGRIYNTALQGQIKVTIIYHSPELIEPPLKPCEVKIGTNNEVQAFGHLAWKWRGNTSELTEQPQAKQKPDIIFSPTEIAENAEKLPEGIFTKITLTGAGCGVLGGNHEVTGNQSALIEPTQLKTWGTQLKVSTPGWTQQHFWNGTKFVGVEPKLIFAGNEAKLTGQFESHADEQEIAIFEK